VSNFDLVCTGGVTRMTVSITALVMEATGGLQVCRHQAQLTCTIDQLETTAGAAVHLHMAPQCIFEHDPASGQVVVCTKQHVSVLMGYTPLR
jgi:hypothetical protein